MATCPVRKKGRGKFYVLKFPVWLPKIEIDTITNQNVVSRDLQTKQNLKISIFQQTIQQIKFEILKKCKDHYTMR